MDQPPRVSVIMGVYNGLAYLDQGAGCILAQTWRDLEFIIIDDGSTDGTGRALAELARRDRRVRVVANQANIGLTRSLNRGLALARGEFIARQDVDDLSLPQRLERQVAFLEAHPQAALVGAAALRIDGKGRPLPAIGRHPCSDRAIRLKMLLQNAFFHASAMVRRSVLIDHRLAYDESLRYAQDYDLWSRVMERAQAANLHEPLIKFRVHEGQISTTVGGEQMACGDRVALANFRRAGLEGDFSEEEVRLMRRVGWPPTALPAGERLAQLRCLLRLFRLADARLPGRDEQWEEVKREWLLNARKILVQPPPGRDERRALWAMVREDPPGAAHDALVWLGRWMVNRLAGVRAPGAD